MMIFPSGFTRTKTNIGVGYPAGPMMHIVASIWNLDSWATDSGCTKSNWNYAPFRAEFCNFAVYGCLARISNADDCYSPEPGGTESSIGVSAHPGETLSNCKE